jgi:hypothetical protein
MEVKMHRTLLGVAPLVLALLLVPAPAHAQAPVVLVCQDGTTQPGSSKVACADHQGMDWDATKVWSEMRAGRYMTRDTVVCTDGQAKPASTGACSAHGGIDSVSTLASLRRRAKARRYVRPSEATADSTKWGHAVNRNPRDQNPPGYRGMERPVGGDSAGASDSASSQSQ